MDVFFAKDDQQTGGLQPPGLGPNLVVVRT